ncbi:MAG: acylphosphatase [Salibacteraceae bacterium]
MTTRKILVRGKVQGVWFRKYTQKKAQELELVGYVRNEPDGSVLIVAQGSEADLDRLEAWCSVGSPKSDVSTVSSTAMESEKTCEAFNIKH